MSDKPNTIPLPKARKLYLTGDVTQASMSELTKQIIDINETDAHLEALYPVYGLSYTRQPIEIHIDTYGGAVYSCFGLLSVMDRSKTPVHTIVTGCAMSCGFMITIHGHKRFAHQHSTLMYHQVSTGMWGKLADLTEDLAETKRLQDKIEEMTIRRTKMPLERLKEVYTTKTDWYLSAEDSLKHGAIDEILA